MPALILCMAGVYRRFREAGYTTPKFLLPLPDGRTVLDTILDGLHASSLGGLVFLIGNERDAEFAPAVREAMARHRIPGAHLKLVGDTSGQAETAMIGAKLAVAALAGDGPVVFHNVDTILTGRRMAEVDRLLRRSDGFIDVFDNDSPAYSYVALEQRNDLWAVTDIAEKRVISRHATTGFYGFASARDYLAWAARTSERSAGEFYISDVYKRMLDDGALITALPDQKGETIVLGTPAEYEGWCDAQDKAAP